MTWQRLKTQLAKKTNQIGISQMLLWTAVTAVVAACVTYLPTAVYLLILLSFFAVPIVPCVILFSTIALSHEKKGHLSVNHGPLKILVVAWFICLIVSVSTCLLIYWGLIY